MTWPLCFFRRAFLAGAYWPKLGGFLQKAYRMHQGNLRLRPNLHGKILLGPALSYTFFDLLQDFAGSFLEEYHRPLLELKMATIYGDSEDQNILRDNILAFISE